MNFDEIRAVAIDEIRAVVAIDFGTTFSGFAYAHKATGEIETNGTWPGREGLPKTNTAIRYNVSEDDELTLSAWGEPALVDTPARKKRTKRGKKQHFVEMFKLHLSNMPKDTKPFLPPKMEFKKPIIDYLREMNQVIQERIETTWPDMSFSQVLYVTTIPAEWNDNAKNTMRECAYSAGIIDSIESEKLEFTSEPEAAAIYCLKVVDEHNLKPGDSFLVVDCGGGTVDLTTRLLKDDKKIDEITVRTGDLCGSTFVDREFLKFLGKRLGWSAMEKVKTENYGQLQYLVQKFFCPRVKHLFDGVRSTFRNIELDIEQYCPILLDCVDENTSKEMIAEDWTMELDFDSIKEMFDPVINKIIKLISDQITDATQKKPLAMFLVGGFSESKYLRKRIREEFQNHIPVIAEPRQPMAAVVKGAVAYGLNMETVRTRTLKWTYGIEVLSEFLPGDPERAREPDGRIFKFETLAERGTQIEVNKEFSKEFKPAFHNQDSAIFKVYYTPMRYAKHCKQRNVFHLGSLRIDLPDTNLGINRPIEFSLTFGKYNLKAKARNKLTDRVYQTNWTMNNFIS
ncbi:hypothetical protein G9A89_015824 [Geosiphon pyriformis]|nr:hypothetical protein G9A89_015824 [Geosiphon pyriformis]